MPFVIDYLRPGDVFLDIGANVGVYSLLASTIPNVTIHAFEPATIAYARLVENLDINGLTQVHPHNIAIGAADGRARLTTERDTTNRIVGSGALETEPAEPVVVRSLDSFLREHPVERVSVIKVDVEGHELGVLQGARETITAVRPTLIVEQNHPNELRPLLASVGYTFYRYLPADRTLELMPDDSNEQNVIAIFDPAAARSRVAMPEALAAGRQTAD